MKIKRNRSKTPIKLIVIIAGAVVLMAGAYTALAYSQSWWPFMSQNNNAEQTPSDEMPDTNNSNDGVVDEDSEIIKDGEGTKEETVKEDEEATSGSADFSVTLNVTNPSANQVRIGTFIYRDQVTSSGSCSLTLSKGASTISRNVGIQPVSKYSTCKLDPINGVAVGTWKATVKVTINGKSVTSSKEVTVQ